VLTMKRPFVPAPCPHQNGDRRPNPWSRQGLGCRSQEDCSRIQLPPDLFLQGACRGVPTRMPGPMISCLRGGHGPGGRWHYPRPVHDPAGKLSATRGDGAATDLFHPAGPARVSRRSLRPFLPKVLARTLQGQACPALGVLEKVRGLVAGAIPEGGRKQRATHEPRHGGGDGAQVGIGIGGKALFHNKSRMRWYHLLGPHRVPSFVEARRSEVGRPWGLSPGRPSFVHPPLRTNPTTSRPGRPVVPRREWVRPANRRQNVGRVLRRSRGEGEEGRRVRQWCR